MTDLKQDLLGLDDAIEILGTSRPTFYRWLRAGKIKGQKAGRQWRFYREDLDRFITGKKPSIELRTNIVPLKETLFDKLSELGHGSINLDADSEVEITCKALTLLAEKMNASDIHLDQFVTGYDKKASALLRFRIEGKLHNICGIDPRLVAPIIEQWKIWTACDPTERFIPQSGTVMLFLLPELESHFDIRVNFMPTRLGECLTARLLKPTDIMEKIDINELGFVDSELSLVKKHLNGSAGLVAITGPSGSGKSTTLHNAIKYLSTPDNKIVTVEDPVEVSLPWAVQANVNPELGMSFSEAIESALRSDPDVLYLGDLPDEKSTLLGLEAAMTGTLVLTCFHAEDTVRALSRIKRTVGNPSLISESVKLLISQRLLRKLCLECSAEYTPSQDEADKIHSAQKRLELKSPFKIKSLRKAVGCKKCSNTGYLGRTAIYEFLEVSPEIAEKISSGSDEKSLQEIAVAQGMKPLLIRALELVAEGKVSLNDSLVTFGIK